VGLALPYRRRVIFYAVVSDGVERHGLYVAPAARECMASGFMGAVLSQSQMVGAG
jgi:hypothetical protein